MWDHTGRGDIPYFTPDKYLKLQFIHSVNGDVSKNRKNH